MKKIALLFSGQGTQKKDMGLALYKEFKIARDLLQKVDKILNIDLKKICFSNPNNVLAQTKYAQIAIFVMDYIRYQIYKQETAVLPTYCAGLSLGEITALACAEAIDFEDALTLVWKRGQFMQEAADQDEGSMIAVQGIDAEALQYLCNENTAEGQIAVISNYNSPSQMVVSGHSEVVSRINLMLKKHGVKATKLNVNAAFHSPLMKHAAEKFSGELKQIKYNDPHFPVISNVTATPYKIKEDIAHLLSKHMLSPVHWYQSIQMIKQEGISYFVELSETNTLSRLVSSIDSVSETRQLYDRTGLDNIIYEISGLAEYHKKKIRYVEQAVHIMTCTKNYNYILEDYEERVKQPYCRLQELYLQLLEERTEKREEDFFRNIYDQTSQCLEAKKIKRSERTSCLKQLEQISSLY